MIRFKKFPILLLALLLVGCAATQPPPTNLPPGVTASEVQNWDKAVKEFSAISVAVKTGSDSVIALNRAGTFPDGPSYKATLVAFQKIDQTGIAAGAYLQTVPSQWGQPVQAKVLNLLGSITAALADASTNGLAGIKDPASQQKFRTILAAVQAGISSIQAILTINSTRGGAMYAFPGALRMEVAYGLA